MQIPFNRFLVLSTAVVVSLLACAAAPGDEPKDKPKKPAEFPLLNKAKDIRVVSDRDEAIQDYFRRNHVIIGGVQAKELKKLLEAREPLAKFFVNYASYNDDPKRASLFGATVEIAPPTETLAKLLDKHKPDGKKTFGITLILRQDEKKAELYHVVGCTDRSSVGFFDDAKKNETDGFSQRELCFKGKPNKQ